MPDDLGVAGKLLIMLLVLFVAVLVPVTLILAVRELIRAVRKMEHGNIDPKHLRWGHYYNTDDERVFIPNKYGWGYHMNYGQKMGRLVGGLNIMLFTCFLSFAFFKSVIFFKILAVIGLAFNVIVNRVYSRDFRKQDGYNAGHWRYGYYYNKEDGRIFVENRNRPGWSLNLGNKYGMTLMIVSSILLLCIFGSMIYHSHETANFFRSINGV